MGDDDIQTATLTGEWRSPYVIVDEEEKDRLMTALIDEQDFEPALTEIEILPSSVSVAVRNGAGIDGVATQAADILKAAGFDIAEIADANQFVYDETLIVYGENEAAATLVLENLSQGVLVPSRGMYTFSTDVLIVVGKDWRSPSATGTSDESD